ncbi:MAG TPA: ATP-binding protein [Armatimonadota bacterium]|jgi:hypothetical protein
MPEQIMSTEDLCQSFPTRSQHAVDRDNKLFEIEALLESGYELVLLEGAEGIGKTTVIAQYVSKHSSSTISFFARGASQYGWDLRVCRADLCNQIEWLIQAPISQPDAVTEDLFVHRTMALQRWIRSRGRQVTIAIDGIEHIPKDAASQIVNMLPLGQPGIQFILSAALAELPFSAPRGIRVETYRIDGFSLHEARQFLHDVVPDERDLKEIYATFRGIPGHLAVVRRILESGTPVGDLFAKMPKTLQRLFQLEWASVGTMDPLDRIVASVICFSRQPCTVELIAGVLGRTHDEVSRSVAKLPFLSAVSGKYITYVSDSAKRFAATELAEHEDAVYDLFIAALLDNAGDASALHDLPAYLSARNRSEELVQLVSRDHLARMLRVDESLAKVSDTATLAALAAKRLGQQADLFRFGLHRSAVIDRQCTEVWRTEIAAMTALGDFAAAALLANSSVLQEERLHSLSVICKVRKTQGLPQDPVVAAQIQQLCRTIDVAALGDRAVDIAADLVYSHPDLAIDLVDTALVASRETASHDEAYARLALMAAADTGARHEPTDTIAKIRERIKDPALAKFTSQAPLIMGDGSVDDILKLLVDLNGSREKVSLLRQWCLDNRKAAGAHQLVSFALDLVSDTTDYSPNGRDLRELATPLPYVEDDTVRDELAARFTAQIPLLEETGPTEELVRLQLIIAESICRTDIGLAQSRVEDVYLQILDIPDLAIRTASMARLLSSLSTLDSERAWDGGRLYQSVREDTDRLVDLLLRDTADHSRATDSIINALACSDSDLAIDIARKLNTVERRDAALLRLIRANTASSEHNPAWETLSEALAGIVDSDVSERGILLILEAMVHHGDSASLSQALSEAFLSRIPRILHMGDRCHAYCLAISWACEHAGARSATAVPKYLDCLKTDWDRIEPGVSKVSIGFRIVEGLAVHRPEEARSYLSTVTELRTTMVIDCLGTANTYLLCLHLTVRAFGGVLTGAAHTEDDLKRIKHLIEYIPGSGMRLSMWCELALRCHFSSQSSLLQRIFTDEIRPILDVMEARNDGSFCSAVVTASPAASLFHLESALQRIETLPASRRDDAYEAIVWCRLTKKAASEPVQISETAVYDLSVEDIVDIVTVLSRIQADYKVHLYIVAIVESVIAKRFKTRFTASKRLDIAQRLESLARSVFPRPRYIQHDGYLLVSLAQIARLRGNDYREWQSLVDKGQLIPNLADRIYVLTEVAACLPDRQSALIDRVLAEIEALIDQVPTDADRVGRLLHLAEHYQYKDRDRAKRWLKQAMKCCAKAFHPGTYSLQRQIVDMAHRIDPAYASALTNLLDNDPARMSAKRRLVDRVDVLNTKQAIIEGKFGNRPDPAADAMMPDVAWEMLQSLNSLSATHRHINDTEPFVESAANMPLSRSYPIWAWVLSNAALRHGNTSLAHTYLRDVFQSAAESTEFAVALAARSAEHLSSYQRLAKLSEVALDDGVSYFGPGERDKALAHLKEFFETNAVGFVTIQDAYFGPDDLEIIALIHDAVPDCVIEVLTGVKPLPRRPNGSSTEALFRSAWAALRQGSGTPDCRITIASLGSSDKAPYHSRLIVTDGCGLELATSLNGLGTTTSSSIRHLDEDAAARELEDMRRYVYGTCRKQGEEEVRYERVRL